MNPTQTERHIILFVDRDPSACERFREIFADSYEVLTATGAAEAWAVARETPRPLAVVIADGRVSDDTGARILAQFRSDAPDAVRVLASDSGDAEDVVDAVNECEVYRCIRKPWEAEQLGPVLGGAVERYERERQKRLLLDEKLFALQRIVGAGQEFGALVLGEALSPWLRRSSSGATAFVEWRRAKGSAAHPPWEEGGLGEVGCGQAKTVLDQVHRVVSALTPGVQPGSEGAASLSGVLRRALGSADPAGAATLENTGEPVEILTRGDLAERLFASLLRCLLPSARSGVPIEAHHSADEPEGVRVRLRAPRGQALQTDQSADLLTAFLLAHHLGGEIHVHENAPDGPGFDVSLPRDPAAVPTPATTAELPHGIEALLQRL